MIQPDYASIDFKKAHKPRAKAARVAGQFASCFDRILERLEPRTFLDGDTVMTDLDGGTDNAAAYLLALAAGEEPLAPAAKSSPAPTTAPTFGAVVVAAPAPSSAPPSGGEDAANPPVTASTNPSTQSARPASDFRYILRPGTGFTGPTPQPGAIGNPGDLGYDAKAIARWDVVPYQAFDEMFNLGVVAFHMNGIKKVSFNVNGAEYWTDVHTPTKNPQTDVYEYVATLRAADFQDGQVELRAIAYPETGQPRVLQGTTITTNGEHSIFLYANANGTQTGPVRYVSPTGDDANDGLTPQTAKKDPALAIASMADANRVVTAGARLYLLPGQHVWKHPAYPSNLTSQGNDTWLTIGAAPGFGRDDVTVVSDLNANGQPYMMSLSRVRWNQVTFRNDVAGPMPYVSHQGSQVWYDGVVVDGQSRYAQKTSFAFGEAPGGRWLTDSVVKNLQDGPQDFGLIRNTAITTTLTGGPWRSSLINVTITDVDITGTQAHAALWRTQGDQSNTILYGFKTPQWDQQAHTIGWGLYHGPGGDTRWNYDDIALVDCEISAGSGIGFVFVLGGKISHLYVRDSSFRGFAYMHPQALIQANVVIENTKFYDYNGILGGNPDFPGVLFR